MKRKYIPMLYLFMGLITGACEQHYNMLTQINPDGSCLRQLSIITRDSVFLAGDTSHNPFPFQLTPQWQLEVYDTATATFSAWPRLHWTPVKNNPSLRVTATQHFSSVEELNHKFRFDHSPWQNIKPEITLKKSFRWFYTYYSFSENYPQQPARDLPVPLSQYLTPKEQKQWFQGDFSSYQGMNGSEIYDYLNLIQDKVYTWTNHCIYLLKYTVIQDFFASQTINPFIQRMNQAQDSIFNLNKSKQDFLTDDFVSVLDQYFQTSFFSTQYHQYESTLDSLTEAKLQVLKIFEPQIKYGLRLPGKVISTNASYITNDILFWKIDVFRFLPADYTLYAHSRQLNLWSLFLTLILTGGILYYLLHPRKRRK